MIETTSEPIPHALLCYENTVAFDWAKKLLANSSVDLLILPEEEKENIKIDDIRKAINHLSQTAHQGGNKVLILLKAHTMPIGAANALLKTLEEPTPNTYIFLVSDYPHLISPTIRSRCQKIKTKIKSKKIFELDELLKSVKQNKLSVFEAAEKIQDKPLLEVLDAWYYYCVENLITSSWLDLLNQARKKILNKQNPNHLLTLEYLLYQWKQLT